MEEVRWRKMQGGGKGMVQKERREKGGGMEREARQEESGVGEGRGGEREGKGG